MIGKIENEQWELQIRLDTSGLGDPRAPKPFWTTMVCGHRRYDRLGDIQVDLSKFESWNEVLSHHMDDPEHDLAIIYPISLLDHSGLRMRLGRHSGWDIGQVGWIFVEGKDVIRYAEEHNFADVEEAKEELDAYVRHEVHEYDLWVWGSVYEVVLLEKNKCDCCGNVDMIHTESLCGILADSTEEILDEFEHYIGSLEEFNLDREAYEEVR